jgi:hypothetical protein
VTVTHIHKGPRGDYVIESVRTKWLQSPGTTTVTKGNVVAGTTPDDGANAFAQAIMGDQYYWVAPWSHTSATATPASDDGQNGEAMLNITTQAMPANGKEKTLIFGASETVALTTAFADDSDMNNMRGFCFHAEDNDWPPCWIAAHLAAVVRSNQIAHPSANITGYGPSTSSVFLVADPFDKADRPTDTEIRTMLNAGVSPIAFSENGSPYLVRHITTRSYFTEGGTDITDYRGREGHITSAIDFAWSIIKQRWNEQKQDFVADDPKDGQKPMPNTTTPGQVKAMIMNVIEDLAGPGPLGQYNGPILAPDKVDMMKASVVASKTTGGISVQADLVAVEHLLKFAFKGSEIGGAY